MAVQYLKRAKRITVSSQSESRRIVGDMLAEIEAGREERARRYGVELDGWEGDILMSKETLEAAASHVPAKLQDDLHYAHERVRTFAERQLASIHEFETELSPGLWAGQKLIPIETAGCYVPSGRYAHVASAIMSIVTAKVAGVRNVVACSAPAASREGGSGTGQGGIHPAILYAMNLCGADHVLALGGVQGIAAMAFGLFTDCKADILVGPGNRFVTEAKRVLFGQTGIDLFAGPTEILIIADATADPDVVACDLAGQAEHGIDSPAWLVTTDRHVAEQVMERMQPLIDKLPEAQREAADAAWRDFGEVVLCDDDEEAAAVSDARAPEHLELQTSNLDWYVKRLRHYGSLFVGEETTVTFGDKCSGPNHILPTKGASRYTGGLSVHKFIKIVTTQRMTREATREVAAVAARISRLEGMEGHARSGDIRLAKYFPGIPFDLAP